MTDLPDTARLSRGAREAEKGKHRLALARVGGSNVGTAIKVFVCAPEGEPETLRPARQALLRSDRPNEPMPGPGRYRQTNASRWEERR